MKTLLTLVLVMILPALADAQTIERNFDVSAFASLGHRVRPVEADGNPATEEWLIQDHMWHRYQVVAVREGQICFGEWFEIARPELGFQTVEPARFGQRDVLLVTEISYVIFTMTTKTTLQLVRFDLPTCR